MDQIYNPDIETMLNLAEELRKKTIQENIDFIQYNQLPQNASDIIQMLTKVEADIFSYLMKYGLELEEIEGKSAFAKFHYGNSEYTIFKKSLIENISNKENIIKTSQPIQNTNTDQEENKSFSDSIKDTENNTEKKKEESVEPLESEDSDEIQEDDELSDDKLSIEENSKDEIDEDEIEEGNDSESINNDFSDNNDTIEDTKPISNGATIIGDDIKEHEPFFPEMEKRTNIADLVYELISLDVKCPNGITKSFEFMVAPLKIFKYKTLLVPIVVAVKSEDSKNVKSSLDYYDSGKNILVINIDDCSFLVRGTFDNNGNFNAIIQTTEKSVDRGDIIEVKSYKVYGNDHNHESINGHPVLHYNSNEGPSYALIFPLNEIGIDDFIIISKTDEFVDYLYSSADNLGAYTATIYENNSAKRIIPRWDDEMLEVDIVEV